MSKPRKNFQSVLKRSGSRVNAYEEFPELEKMFTPYKKCEKRPKVQQPSSQESIFFKFQRGKKSFLMVKILFTHFFFYASHTHEAKISNNL